MKILITTLAATAALAVSFNAGAADAKAAQTIAKSNGCTACHGVDTKLVGPSYQDVAKKYNGDPQAETKLIKKVKDGGSGVWGQIPMPPHPNLSETDLKTVVDWILSMNT